MSDSAFSFEFGGLAALIQEFTDKEKDLNGIGAILEESRQAWTVHVANIFATEGRAGGTAWPGLSERRIKERGDSGHMILDYTHDLYRAADMLYQSFNGDKITGTYVISNNDGSRQRQLKMTVTGDKVRVQTQGKQRVFWPWGETEQDILYAPFEKWANDWVG